MFSIDGIRLESTRLVLDGAAAIHRLRELLHPDLKGSFVLGLHSQGTVLVSHNSAGISLMAELPIPQKRNMFAYVDRYGVVRSRGVISGFTVPPVPASVLEAHEPGMYDPVSGELVAPLQLFESQHGSLYALSVPHPESGGWVGVADITTRLSGCVLLASGVSYAELGDGWHYYRLRTLQGEVQHWLHAPHGLWRGWSVLTPERFLQECRTRSSLWVAAELVQLAEDRPFGWLELELGELAQAELAESKDGGLLLPDDYVRRVHFPGDEDIERMMQLISSRRNRYKPFRYRQKVEHVHTLRLLLQLLPHSVTLMLVPHPELAEPYSISSFYTDGVQLSMVPFAFRDRSSGWSIPILVEWYGSDAVGVLPLLVQTILERGGE